jgi:hypothetical protein
MTRAEAGLLWRLLVLMFHSLLNAVPFPPPDEGP